MPGYWSQSRHNHQVVEYEWMNCFKMFKPFRPWKGIRFSSPRDTALGYIFLKPYWLPFQHRHFLDFQYIILHTTLYLKPPFTA